MKRENISTIHKIALIGFFSALYFYSHIGTLYMQARGLDLFQVSTITAVIVGTIFLAEVPTGVIADKVGRKWSVVLALLFQLFGEVLYYFSESYVMFLLIAVIAGIGFAFLSGALEALVYDSITSLDKEREMQKAMGLYGAAAQLASVVAPIIGGVLVSSFVITEYRLVIGLTAVSVAIAFLISLTVTEPEVDQDTNELSPMEVLRNGIKVITTSRELLRLLLISVFTLPFAGVLNSFYQPHFVNNSVDPFWFGAALSIGAFISMLAQKYAYKLEDRLGKRFGFLLSLITPGILYLLMGLIVGPVWALVLFVLVRGTSAIRNPILSARQNELIPSSNRATVLSLINMVGRLYEALGGLILGWIALSSVSIVFVIIGGVIIVSALLLTPKDFSGSDI